MQASYFFTTYGSIYVGVEWEDMNFPDFQIVVPKGKLQKFRELYSAPRSLDDIKKLAWVFPKNALRRIIRGEEIDIPRMTHLEYAWKGDYTRKIMFIFGAGASAFCVPNSQSKTFQNDLLRPPLGNGLFRENFKDYYSKYEGVKCSLLNLQKGDCNVEEILEQEWQEIQDYCNQNLMSRHINIQFYLQELLRDISANTLHHHATNNLYANLADKLQRIHSKDKRQHFAFVSFNQDTILDTFLSRFFKRQLNTLNDYVDVNDSPFVLFKPHGSWNWGWPFTKKIENMPAYLYENDIDFCQLYFNLLGNPVDMVDWHSFGTEWSINGKGKMAINKKELKQYTSSELGQFFPAIVLPYRDKDEFTMPPVHQRRLEAYLGGIETLIVVGWKGNEAVFNKKMNTLMVSALKKVVIVDPAYSQVENNLKFLLQRPNIENVTYAGGFEEFVARGLEKILDSA